MTGSCADPSMQRVKQGGFFESPASVPFVVFRSNGDQSKSLDKDGGKSKRENKNKQDNKTTTTNHPHRGLLLRGPVGSARF